MYLYYKEYFSDINMREYMNVDNIDEYLEVFVDRFLNISNCVKRDNNYLILLIVVC